MGRPRKNPNPQPAEAPQRLTPLRINKLAMIAVCRRLAQNEDFRVLQSAWVTERHDILSNGKQNRKKPGEAQDALAELSGFDRAVLLVDKWATIETPEDRHLRQAKELEETLGGNAK